MLRPPKDTIRQQLADAADRIIELQAQALQDADTIAELRDRLGHAQQLIDTTRLLLSDQGEP